MPTKNFRAFYRGLDDAVEGLYRDELLTLADDEKTPDFGFDSRVFERAAEWVRERGGFTPSMLQEQPARDVIDETFRILGGAVSSSIGEEMPAELTGLLENNAFIFSGLKTYHSLNEVGLSLIGDDGGIKPFEKFHEDVAKIDAKYNRNYLYAEYNHAVTSSQMAAKWHDFQQDGDRYNLQYRTANDERVREEHQRLHNITLPVSDPFWEQFMPPNGWNCRCEAIQVPEDDVQETPEGSYKAPFIPQLFRTNSGQTGLIFPKGHPYYTDVPNSEIRRAIAYLPPENGYLDGHINLSGRQVPVRHHVMHNLDELPGNNEVLSDLLRLKPEITEVSLLPDIHYKDADLKPKFYPENWKFHNKDKNADAVLSFGKQEEWVVDFKRLQGNGKHLAPHLEKAAQQADYAIIKLPENRSESIKSICNTADKKLDSTELKGILIIDNDGQLVYERYKTKSAVKR